MALSHSPARHKSNRPSETDTTDFSPTSSRPKPYTAVTVIPALHPAEGRQSQRTRSKTNFARSSAIPAPRRRAGTTPYPRPTPLDVERATLEAKPSIPQRLASLPEVPSDRPSSPIPIPQRQREKSPPTTPLTARARSPISYFGGTNPRPHISDSLTPYYTTGTRTASGNQPAASIPVVQRGFAGMGPRPASPLYGYTPTSPLSPTTPLRPPLDSGRPKERRSAKAMNLASLPKFHPANFPSKDPGPAPTSPRNSRSVTSQPRPARKSDAQQKLHQYQRELIANATQSSRSLLTEGITPKPLSPRLTPLRSPIDPMTPLALEGQGDYLLAGCTTTPSGFQANDGREMVERLVQRENQRRRYPEARSGSVSPALSPAVSPAGGHG